MGLEELIFGLSVTSLVALTLFIPAVRDLVFNFLSTARDFLGQFIQTAPKGLKIILFFFFMIFVIGGTINTVTDTFYFCNDGEIRKANSFLGGLTVHLVVLGSQLNESDIELNEEGFQSLLVNETSVYYNPDEETPRGMFQVRCKNSKAHLTLWGLPVFDIEAWIVLFILAGAIKVYVYVNRK